MTEGISIILPVFNQAKALPGAIALWAETLEKMKRSFEIVVINDGSGDSSSDILAAMQANPKQGYLKVHQNAHRMGYGACLQTGFGMAEKELFLATALNYPYSPDDLKPMLKSLAQKNEETGQRVSLVSGCRMDRPYIGRRAILNDAKRYATRVMFGHLPERPLGLCSAYSASQWWRLRLQFGIRFHDTFSAFKLFRRELLDRIVLQSHSKFVLAELLAKATFLGHLMDEVPVALSASAMPWSAEPEFDPAQYRRDRFEVFQRPAFVRKVKQPEPVPALAG